MVTERESWEFDAELGRDQLAERFKVQSLESFGIEEGDEHAVGAAGALLRYLARAAARRHAASRATEDGAPGRHHASGRDDEAKSRARRVDARRRSFGDVACAFWIARLRQWERDCSGSGCLHHSSSGLR